MRAQNIATVWNHSHSGQFWLNGLVILRDNMNTVLPYTVFIASKETVQKLKLLDSPLLPISVTAIRGGHGKTSNAFVRAPSPCPEYKRASPSAQPESPRYRHFR